MYEVEVKVRADHDAVRDRLEARGAEHLGTVEQVDTYYDAPHREFAETDEAVRLRRERRLDGTPDSPDGNDRESPGESGPDPPEVGSPGRGVENHQPHVVLTYKGPLLEAESKSREEYETAVADPGDAAAILRHLGFDPAATVEKERDRYELAGYTVTLDRVADLGTFVEVESESEDGNLADARDGALTLLESLGLDPAAQIRTSYLGLLLDADDEAP